MPNLPPRRGRSGRAGETLKRDVRGWAGKMSDASNIRTSTWRLKASDRIRAVLSVIWAAWWFMLVFGVIHISTIDQLFFPAVYWQEQVSRLEAELKQKETQLAAGILDLALAQRSAGSDLTTSLLLMMQNEPDPQEALKLAAAGTLAEIEHRVKLVSSLSDQGRQLRAELDRARAEPFAVGSEPG